MTFNLDLAPFVDDKTLTAVYSVVSGGGSFTGSVYSQAFPTLGSYTVEFKVVDFRGNSATASFVVKVTTAELGVVLGGTGISLYDTATGNLETALQNDGTSKTFKTSLTDGSLLFEFSVTGQTDLFLYNSGDKDHVSVATDSLKSEAYAAKTSADKIVYVKGSSPNRSVHLFDPVNEGTLAISAGTSGLEVPDERDPLVTSDDIVYFESALSSGADIYYYEVTAAKTVAASTHANDEDLLAVLPDNGVVFRRRSDNGGWQLFYYKKGAGAVEIGADLGMAYENESRTYRGKTSDSRVVFETTSSGASPDTDVHIWNPSTLQTVTIAGGASDTTDQTFQAVSGSGRVVYLVETSTTDHDLFVFNPADNTSVELDGNTDIETYNGALTGTLTIGDIVFTRNDGSDLDLHLFDESASSSSAIAASGTNEVFAKVLSDDNVVYTVGTDLHHYDTSTSTDTSVVTGAGTETFAGETTGGNFVITLDDGSQKDLYLWNGTIAVVVSTVAGNDTYQTASSTGRVLFTRVASGATVANLFMFNPSDSSTTQITNNTVNDSVLAVVNAVDNN